MTLLTFRLREVGTRTELGDRLGVNVRALDLVSLTSDRCTTPGCNLPGVENNNKRCVLHQQSWYPRLFNDKGRRLKNCRGHGLHGPQFMYGYGGATKPKVCCCDSSKCEEIGYSHEGMMSLPQDPANCKEAIRVLGIQSPDLRKKLAEKPGNYRIAPWHYNRRHRARGGKGWEIRKMSKYRDDDGAYFSFPPPNGSLQKFIDEEIPSYGFCRGGYDDTLISEGFPGAISDVVATDITNILEQVPFGNSVEVDKGFLVENSCALLGIASIRPMKMLEKQTQQSKEDAALTQKVGKTRIPIEQANGQMKRSTGFFDRNIRLDQLGLADLIFRASYLLQNFKLPFIQDRDEDAPKTGRPCKAAIRWYGETDDGLVDIRPEVEMWGTAKEIALWRALRNKEENENLSDTEISELVLEKDLPSTLRAEHIAKLEALANGPH